MTLIKSRRQFVDAYGEQLWSYFKTGEPKREIVERDDGLISLGQYGGKLYFSEYKDWQPIEKQAMKYTCEVSQTESQERPDGRTTTTPGQV